ncbi:MAG TPA: histidine--tRNA ligase [Actinomycetota bacterium]|nr:histidine--tRNA ligase [Actinomycetota bacterium]
MELNPPRGTADLLPPGADAMLDLYEEAHRLARLFGYRYVDTPAFEHTELFSRAAGETSDVVTKEMYTFEDKGGRSLTLRPEGTAPVVRAYLDRAHDLPSPFKGYYLFTMWRHGRPQAGRMREFRQFGVEAIGEPGPGPDAEVIVVADRFLRERGLARLRLLVNSIGDEVCRPAYRAELLAYLEASRERISDEHRDRFRENPLRVLDCKDEACVAVAAGAPIITDRLCAECADHFSSVRAALDEEGVAYEVEPRLVRGLDYYTRTAFEFASGVLSRGQATLCGGGRYDGLAEVLGGSPTPGVGFGLGLERVLLAMEKEGLAMPAGRGPACYLVTLGEEAAKLGRELVRELRAAGVPAAAGFEERPLGAQMRAADRAGAAYAVIVGEREVADGTATLRRLSDGEQETIAAAGLVQKLKGLVP